MSLSILHMCAHSWLRMCMHVCRGTCVNDRGPLPVSDLSSHLVGKRISLIGINDRWFQCFSHLCLLVCHRNTLGLWMWATLYSFSLGSGNSNSDPQHLRSKHCAPSFKSYFWVLLPSLTFIVLLPCCFDARSSLISRHYLMSTRKSVFVINLTPTLKL